MIYANVPSATEAQWQQIEYIMAYYGFETIMDFGRLPLRDRVHRLGENILIALTIFAQNARSPTCRHSHARACADLSFA